MARLPGYIVLSNKRICDGQLTYDMQVRPWHPSFWPVLWRSLDVHPRFAKPIGWLVAMAVILRGPRG